MLFPDHPNVHSFRRHRLKGKTGKVSAVLSSFLGVFFFLSFFSPPFFLFFRIVFASCLNFRFYVCCLVASRYLVRHNHC